MAVSSTRKHRNQTSNYTQSANRVHVRTCVTNGYILRPAVAASRRRRGSVPGSGFRVPGSGSGFWVLGSGSGFRVPGSGSGFTFRVQAPGSRFGPRESGIGGSGIGDRGIGDRGIGGSGDRGIGDRGSGIGDRESGIGDRGIGDRGLPDTYSRIIRLPNPESRIPPASNRSR
jgi:hypothetical protein